MKTYCNKHQTFYEKLVGCLDCEPEEPEHTPFEIGPAGTWLIRDGKIVDNSLIWSSGTENIEDLVYIDMEELAKLYIPVKIVY